MNPSKDQIIADLRTNNDFLRRQNEALQKADAKLFGELAALRELQGDRNHPEHYCHRCGGRYADNSLWNRVVEDRGEILCPLCFVELAIAKGVDPTAWRISGEGDSSEIDNLRVELHNAKEESANLCAELAALQGLLAGARKVVVTRNRCDDRLLIWPEGARIRFSQDGGFWSSDEDTTLTLVPLGEKRIVLVLPSEAPRPSAEAIARAKANLATGQFMPWDEAKKILEAAAEKTAEDDHGQMSHDDVPR